MGDFGGSSGNLYSIVIECLKSSGENPNLFHCMICRLASMEKMLDMVCAKLLNNKRKALTDKFPSSYSVKAPNSCGHDERLKVSVRLERDH